jgi:hypothetical protein
MDEILLGMSYEDQVERRFDLEMLGFSCAEKISNDPPGYRWIDPNLVTYDHKTKTYMAKG